MTRLGVRFGALLVLSVLCVRGPFAATPLRGLVTFDGVPVPGATVTATSGERRVVAITDSAGRYGLPELADGHWTIEVEMTGFVTAKGDASTGTWELKMLSIAEMNAEVARKSQLVAPPVTVARDTEPEAPLPRSLTGVFANISPEILNQSAAEGLPVGGTAAGRGAAWLLAQPGHGSDLAGALAQPLYYGSAGIFPGFPSLDARSFSRTGQDTPKARSQRLTASLNCGGPVIPGKHASFFLGYQRTQNSNSNTVAGRMPTTAERSGLFSAAITDPLAGLPFPENTIPQTRISPQARSLLTLYPVPNFDAVARYNYQIPIAGETHQDALQARWNEPLNTKSQIFGNFDLRNTRSSAPGVLNFQDTTGTGGINTAINWTTRPNPRFSATLGYQFSRLSTRTTPYFSNQLNVSRIAGVHGNNQEAVNWGPPGLVFSGGTSNLSDGQYASLHNQTHTASYGSFWNHRLHNVTFGAEVRRQQSNVLSQQDPRGTFAFTGAATGSDLADFLLGMPGTSSLAFGNADKYFRQTFYSAFITDDWKINRGLTFTAGARWEYEVPIRELYGRLVNLAIAPGYTEVTLAVGNNFVRPDRSGIQPRMALAWRPLTGSRLIVRGGYGVHRNTTVYQSIADQMAQQAPLSKSLSVQNTASNPLTLENGFIAGSGTLPVTFAIDPNFRVGYAQNWSISLQYDLPAAVQMTVLYTGTKGARLPQESLPNTFPAAALNPTGYVYLTSNGNSRRESGQIQLRRRLRSGLTATAKYTYSKASDDAPDMAGGQVITTSGGGTSIAQNWLDLAAERGPSSFDQPHRLSLQAQYSTGEGVPGGMLIGGRKGAVLRDWAILSSVIVGSGLPETPVYFAAVNGTGVTGSLRPDATGVSIHAAPAGLFLNPAAFRAPAAGHWGNAGRNSISGPAQFDWNASLGRTLRLRGVSVDLRLDVMNVLNHVTFRTWNATVNSTQFGLPATINAMRSVQPTLRLNF